MADYTRDNMEKATAMTAELYKALRFYIEGNSFYIEGNKISCKIGLNVSFDGKMKISATYVGFIETETRNYNITDNVCEIRRIVWSLLDDLLFIVEKKICIIQDDVQSLKSIQDDIQAFRIVLEAKEGYTDG